MSHEVVGGEGIFENLKIQQWQNWKKKMYYHFGNAKAQSSYMPVELRNFGNAMHFPKSLQENLPNVLAFGQEP